jgi:hypothetical protein
MRVIPEKVVCVQVVVAEELKNRSVQVIAA